MRFVWPALLLLSCGTTLDGGIHAERCGTAAATGLPICSTGDRCNSANDCIPACNFVGCLEGACIYRAESCTAPSCATRPTLGACVDCAKGASPSAALTTCLCLACAADCGSTTRCGGTASTTDACASCAINALVHPGLCSSDARFQDDCFGSASPACRVQAQAIVGCRR